MSEINSIKGTLKMEPIYRRLADSLWSKYLFGSFAVIVLLGATALAISEWSKDLPPLYTIVVYGRIVAWPFILGAMIFLWLLMVVFSQTIWKRKKHVPKPPAPRGPVGPNDWMGS